jgi:hypothetical protein
MFSDILATVALATTTLNFFYQRHLIRGSGYNHTLRNKLILAELREKKLIHMLGEVVVRKAVEPS